MSENLHTVMVILTEDEEAMIQALAHERGLDTPADVLRNAAA